MREFNINQDDYDKTEEGIASVEKVNSDTLENKSQKSTLLQKLTTIFFIVIVIIACLLTIRIFFHIRSMQKYNIPDDALVAENSTQDTEDKEDVKYVNEVVYNPSDLGNALADAQNDFSGADDLESLQGEQLWYNGAGGTWKFMSGYDYQSSSIDCVWICYNSKKEILAYHTAQYDGGTNTFKNGNTEYTKKGAESIGAD